MRKAVVDRKSAQSLQPEADGSEPAAVGLCGLSALFEPGPDGARRGPAVPSIPSMTSSKLGTNRQARAALCSEWTARKRTWSPAIRARTVRGAPEGVALLGA
jgi:hypothetical protein